MQQLDVGKVLESLRERGELPWDDIGEFVKKFYYGTLQRNHLPPAVLNARYAHLHEELVSEYAAAIQSGDVQKQLDSLIDFIWVAMTTVKLMNIDFPEAWRRVARANFAKQLVPACLTGRTTIVTVNGGKYDLAKPAGWVAPEFGDMLENPAERIMRRYPPDPDYVCGADFCDDPACNTHGKRKE